VGVAQVSAGQIIDEPTQYAVYAVHAGGTVIATSRSSRRQPFQFFATVVDLLRTSRRSPACIGRLRLADVSWHNQPALGQVVWDHSSVPPQPSPISPQKSPLGRYTPRMPLCRRCSRKGHRRHSRDNAEPARNCPGHLRSAGCFRRPQLNALQATPPSGHARIRYNQDGDIRGAGNPGLVHRDREPLPSTGMPTLSTLRASGPYKTQIAIP